MQAKENMLSITKGADVFLPQKLYCVWEVIPSLTLHFYILFTRAARDKTLVFPNMKKPGRSLAFFTALLHQLTFLCVFNSTTVRVRVFLYVEV